MIVREQRWYHYIMMPFGAQAIVTISAFLITVLQMGIYSGLEDYDAVWEGQCDVTLGPTNEQGEVTRQGAIMQCGDDARYLGALEAPYLYELLTTGEEPAIVCIKIVGEYLGDVRWSCEMNTDEEKV